MPRPDPLFVRFLKPDDARLCLLGIEVAAAVARGDTHTARQLAGGYSALGALRAAQAFNEAMDLYEQTRRKSYPMPSLTDPETMAEVVDDVLGRMPETDPAPGMLPTAIVTLAGGSTVRVIGNEHGIARMIDSAGDQRLALREVRIVLARAEERTTYVWAQHVAMVQRGDDVQVGSEEEA